MKIPTAGSCAVLLATLIQGHALTPTAPCEDLSSLALTNAAITLAETVPAGPFTLPPTGTASSQTLGTVPALCRIAATLEPSSDSDIKIEVWLPASGWNGKFQGVGNGAFAGSIAYGPMVTALNRGYATASTDTGHTGRSGEFAFGHPEKVADFAYRAVHEMTVTARAIMEAFYGSAPSLSYWNGCSAGGGQGVMEAHRFPDDYDGIVAGAPGSPLGRGYAAWRLWLAGATLKDPASALPPSAFPVIHDAVLRACDAGDGLKDGLIDDPTRCDFDPDVLACQGADTQACLTVAQVAAVRKLLSPAINPRTGALIFPPLEPGSELDWARVSDGEDAPAFAVDAFRYVFLKDPDWDWRTLDFDRDLALAGRKIEAANLHPLEPDLTAFADRGGKLLLYQGWNDSANAPQSTINYYNRIRNILGEAATSDTVRLFMVPGMGHCRGGEGPNSFDRLGVLEQWVENGKAPDRIIASHSTDGTVDRTRPLCPYPQVARYIGTGSIDDAANFECKMP